MPATPRNAIAEVIVNKLDTTTDMRTLAKEIAVYLVTEDRASELQSIMRDVMTKRQQDGLVEADVRVAYPLLPATLTELSELIKAEFPNSVRIKVDQTLDKSIIGGARINTAHEQLDLSVRGKLDTFKRLTNQGTI